MKNEMKLIENKEMRKELVGKTEVLDKVKEVILLPYGESMTTQMVADYYEVGLKTLQKLIERNKEELISNGLSILIGKELKEFKTNFDADILSVTKINKANRSLATFTRRAILNVGMLLRDSEIAKEVRTRLLDMTENKETIHNVINDIDEEQKLMLAVMCSKDETEQMVAMANYKRYKDEKLNKITDERNVAVDKVVNLTKSDCTFGLREAKGNLGCGEKQLREWLIKNKFIYRKPKQGDEKGKPTGRLMAYSDYTKEGNRYFTDIVQVDRLGHEHHKMVFTVEGIEFFRTKIDEIKAS